MVQVDNPKLAQLQRVLIPHSLPKKRDWTALLAELVQNGGEAHDGYQV